MEEQKTNPEAVENNNQAVKTKKGFPTNTVSMILIFIIAFISGSVFSFRLYKSLFTSPSAKLDQIDSLVRSYYSGEIDDTALDDALATAYMRAINDKSALEAKNKQYEAAINKLEKEVQVALAAANSSGKNPVIKSGRFTWPVPGFYNVTSYYGYRVNPVSGIYKLHGGIDIASAGIYGKAIVAAADGVVVSAGWNSGGFGNWVVINHGMSGGNQFATLYAHMCRAPIVSAGQSVKAGQTIGYVGSTGNSTGNHLHFEVRVNGNRVNPMSYFNKAG